MAVNPAVIKLTAISDCPLILGVDVNNFDHFHENALRLTLVLEE